MDTFSHWSGLRVNSHKSALFISSDVPNREELCRVVEFPLHSFPFKYLGVPITSGKPRYADFLPLIENLKGRINAWQNRFLSYAARVSLIISVLNNMSVHLAALVVVPKRVTKEMERILKAFLWTGKHAECKGGKVKWSELVLPRENGGLGILSFTLLQRMYRLQGQSLWALPVRHSYSWFFRSLLSLRPLIYPVLWHRIGNGENTFFWFDNWHVNSPLWDQVELLGVWNWIPMVASVSWVVGEGDRLISRRFGHLLDNILGGLTLSCSPDLMRWAAASDGNFSTASARSLGREVGAKVPWAVVVWRQVLCPKYAFFLWLAIKNRLRTKDRWFGTFDPICVLCKVVHESRDHLFLECAYSKTDDFFIKASFQMALYHIWHERNKHIYQQVERHQYTVSTFNANAFIQLMLVDGCFVLQFIHNLVNKHKVEHMKSNIAAFGERKEKKIYLYIYFFSFLVVVCELGLIWSLEKLSYKHYYCPKLKNKEKEKVGSVANVAKSGDDDFERFDHQERREEEGVSSLSKVDSRGLCKKRGRNEKFQHLTLFNYLNMFYVPFDVYICAKVCKIVSRNWVVASGMKNYSDAFVFKVLLLKPIYGRLKFPDYYSFGKCYYSFGNLHYSYGDLFNTNLKQVSISFNDRYDFCFLPNFDRCLLQVWREGTHD
ncbi:hypothetical protein K2173_010954 [Erythroxylum novogranatense]|uniref:Reverse transcriptase zinc-binding domain-containing protein n=1 Tax=Erythroxylum novogranatense TaxID=1862640 RepID=A0AAV8T1E6_9ROSI|nr:hypothetical protein K2173_010954 [Erythroxylum novogranatense]